MNIDTNIYIINFKQKYFHKLLDILWVEYFLKGYALKGIVYLNNDLIGPLLSALHIEEVAIV